MLVDRKDAQKNHGEFFVHLLQNYLTSEKSQIDYRRLSKKNGFERKMLHADAIRIPIQRK